MPRSRDEQRHEHERKYGPPGYTEWGWRLPCIVVGCKTTRWRPGTQKVIECCHLGNEGLSRKSHWTRTFFACWVHHDESYSGRERFEARYALRVAPTFDDYIDVATLEEAVAVTQIMWDRYQNLLAD